LPIQALPHHPLQLLALLVQVVAEQVTLAVLVLIDLRLISHIRIGEAEFLLQPFLQSKLGLAQPPHILEFGLFFLILVPVERVILLVILEIIVDIVVKLFVHSSFQSLIVSSVKRAAPTRSVCRPSRLESSSNLSVLIRG